MKRCFYFGILIISSLLLAVSIRYTTDNYYFDDLLISKSDYDNLKIARKPAASELLNSVSLDNISLFYNEPDQEWFFSVPAGTEFSKLSADFQSNNKNVKIAFCEVIKPGISIPFIAYTDFEYKEYFLVATTLPLIRIECAEDFISLMDYNLDTFPGENIRDEVYPMKFTLIDNRPERIQSVISSEGTIHVYGGTTLYMPKKNMRIALLEKNVGEDKQEYDADLLGLRQDGDWLLYAGYNDQEKVRNVFSANLWTESCGYDNSFGLKNGIEYRYAELFINQQYWGLYALGYPFDEKQTGIKPSNQGHYDEFLYKQQAFGPNDEGSDGIILQFDADESDQNNGVLIMGMYFDLIQNQNTDSLWHNDMMNAIDFWLYMKLCQAYDTVRYYGQSKNMFYTVKLTETGRKILFTPWDGDNYWGNIWSVLGKNRTIPYGLKADDNSYENTVNPISFLRKQDPEINTAIQNRYAELRDTYWADSSIDEMLDKMEQDIYDSGAYLREMKRWPDSSFQDPELKLSVFRTYVHDRFYSMDDYITNLDQQF